MSSTPGPTSTPVNSGSSSSSTVTISSILNSVRAEFPGHRGPDKVKPLSKAANDARRDDDKEWCDHQKRLEFLRKEAENLENTNWMYESVDKLLGMGK